MAVDELSLLFKILARSDSILEDDDFWDGNGGVARTADCTGGEQDEDEAEEESDVDSDGVRCFLVGIVFCCGFSWFSLKVNLDKLVGSFAIPMVLCSGIFVVSDATVGRWADGGVDPIISVIGVFPPGFIS